ncbi:hypothetical protein R6V09_29520 [Streptomyces sp. W16]|uniref:hypothetical protein n=1 Tax=Streptomyces sp. W16 TaxID=3076631 RepID=UPI00295B2843|nr:hypothetical protein [Streptomyces sp. W16]MDV9174236.1 hypothetical protein [Streptomyces sp. W16]
MTTAPKTPVGRNTPEGSAVIALRQQLTDLEERAGEWPGADVVDILGTWLEQFDFTAAPQPAVVHIPPRPPGQAWVLHRWDRHESAVIELFADEDSALAELARHARGNWDNLLGDDDVPDEPPADDSTAVELYYGPDRDNLPDEGYSLYAETVRGRGRPRIVPLDFAFPDAGACERANRAAVFHPGDHGDLPCVEVDDVLVFAHLDHEVGAFRVSVHVDNAPDHLVRPDGTVPLRVEVEDTIVLDDSNTEGAPKPPLLDALLNAADAVRIRKEPILAAALGAGLLWRCPACQWDNAGAATCCEGPGPCRTPKPDPGVEAERTSREP